MCSLGLDSVGSAHFKFSTHPGVLWHPVPLLPLCLLQGRLVWGNTQEREDGPGLAEAMQAVNLCGNETMCSLHTRRPFTPLPTTLPPPVGNKAPSVSPW